MKPVKNFVFAVLLVSAMAISTLAGEHRHSWLCDSTATAAAMTALMTASMTILTLNRLTALRLKRQITCFSRRWQPFYQCTEKRTPKQTTVAYARVYPGGAWFCVSGLTDHV